MAARPQDWATLIRCRNWRPVMVGCACALAVQDRRFFDDMQFSFDRNSWAVPQLAVAMGQLHPAEARHYFETIVRRPKLPEHTKQRAAALQTLICLGARPTAPFNLDDWDLATYDDARGTQEIVQNHWDFWRNHFENSPPSNTNQAAVIS